MEKTHMGIRTLHHLPGELHHKTEDTMGCRVLGTKVPRKVLYPLLGVLSYPCGLYGRETLKRRIYSNLFHGYGLIKRFPPQNGPRIFENPSPFTNANPHAFLG
jgi:hypothetical protein